MAGPPVQTLCRERALDTAPAGPRALGMVEVCPPAPDTELADPPDTATASLPVQDTEPDGPHALGKGVVFPPAPGTASACPLVLDMGTAGPLAQGTVQADRMTPDTELVGHTSPDTEPGTVLAVQIAAPPRIPAPA